MKIGITGATGHVGANVVRQLKAEGFEVRTLVRDDVRALEGITVEKAVGDLLHKESLNMFCQGQDVMIHLAAFISVGTNSYQEVYKINVTGTQNLVNACKQAGVKRFIHFSSIHALEQMPYDQLLDESRQLSVNSSLAYERTKALAEQWVLKQNNPDFEVIILNPTAIVGPYDFKPSMLGQVIKMIYKGSLPGLIPGGYNWVDVRDVSTATVSAIRKGKPGERYILSGHYYSLKAFAGLIAELKGKKNRIPVFPFWLARLGVPFMGVFAKLIGKNQLYTCETLWIVKTGNKNISCEKAGRELGFSPRPLKETLKDTLLWFQEISYF